MSKIKYAEYFSLLIILVALGVLFGWVFQIDFLKNPFSYGIAMKFITAVCFIFSGIILSVISKTEENNRYNDYSQIILPILSLFIMLIMVPPMFSMLFGIHFDTEMLIVSNRFEKVLLIGLGMPSFNSTIGFILIALISLLEILKIKRKKIFILTLDVILLLISLFALLGYLVNAPIMYFQIIDKSVGMALLTAILFMLWSLGLIFCYRSKNA